MSERHAIQSNGDEAKQQVIHGLFHVNCLLKDERRMKEKSSFYRVKKARLLLFGRMLGMTNEELKNGRLKD